ncbi:MAG TPA: cytochrome P450 [Solirubrobacteraceae bacterium]|nr:cytochrome P450 [Solirubrobacteraceae bacterium]
MSWREVRSALPPGPRVPGAMQLAATWKRPAASLERMRQRYGTRVTVKLPFQPPFVILSDPDDIKELFTAPPDVLHPGEGARVLEPLIGRNSVILLDEGPHLEQRRLLLPTFHGEKMQRQIALMAELAVREVETWPCDRPVALHPRLQQLTLEIILRTVFGLEQGRQLDELRDALTGVLAFTENPLSVLPALQRIAGRFGPTKRFEQQKARADALIYDLIAERRAAGDSDRDDVLAMLLQARHEDDSPMSAQELRDELMTALVAGHETTASQLAWMFERLAREPAVVRRLVDELTAASSDEYLTATINEVLRIKPVLPNAEPRLTKKPVRIGGFTYPAGVALLASAYLVHHDPAIYEHPRQFRPERFLEKPPGTYTWIPFGGGRRRCLGASFAVQEMKVVSREVLLRYELAPAAARPEPTGRRSITFSPAGGATVILRPRRPAATVESDRRPLAIPV